ncbi:MAG: hypothetical protein H0X24_10165 [Ktedonobacterales bacterium]|nr:hypothetical protein [Ktedonobacterales bacterium]
MQERSKLQRWNQGVIRRSQRYAWYGHLGLVTTLVVVSISLILYAIFPQFWCAFYRAALVIIGVGSAESLFCYARSLLFRRQMLTPQEIAALVEARDHAVDPSLDEDP